MTGVLVAAGWHVLTRIEKVEDGFCGPNDVPVRALDWNENGHAKRACAVTMVASLKW